MTHLDRLSCSALLERLAGYLDGESVAVDPGLIEAHLAACARCARKYRFERTLLDGLRRAARTTRAPLRLRTRVESLLAALAP